MQIRIDLERHRPAHPASRRVAWGAEIPWTARPFAVERLGKTQTQGTFADRLGAGKQIGVPDPILSNEAPQPGDRRFIPNQTPAHVAILSQRLTNPDRLL